jgi:hypothetical protein
LALGHPEAEFIAVRRAAEARLPLYGTFRGRAGAVAFLQDLADAFQTEYFERDGLLGDAHNRLCLGPFPSPRPGYGQPFRQRLGPALPRARRANHLLLILRGHGRAGSQLQPAGAARPRLGRALPVPAGPVQELKKVE